MKLINKNCPTCTFLLHNKACILDGDIHFRFSLCTGAIQGKPLVKRIETIEKKIEEILNKLE